MEEEEKALFVYTGGRSVTARQSEIVGRLEHVLKHFLTRLPSVRAPYN